MFRSLKTHSTAAHWLFSVRNLADAVLTSLDRNFVLAAFVLHAMALWSFGSVMWVDASTYIRIAQALSSVDAMRSVYDGSTLWWHNYVPPGVSLVWLAVRGLPEAAIWPLVAVLQHGVAVAALVSAVRAARHMASSRLHALAALLLCLHPFYQAFHNSLGTESAASSLLLFGFAVLLRSLGDVAWSWTRFWQLLALAAAASLFRHGVVLLLVGFALATATRHRKLIGAPLVAAALVTAASLYWFALGRASITGEFIAPRPGLSSLYFAPRVNLAPSADVRRVIAEADWPPGLTSDTILAGKAEYAQFEDAARRWRSQGLSNAQVLDRFETLGKRVRHDGVATEARAVAHGTVAAGIDVPCFMAGAGENFSRGMTNAQACEVNRAWTKVFAWVAVDRKLVSGLFAGSFTDAAVPDLQAFERAWMRWFKEAPRVLRDPLGLGWIDLSALTIAFLVAAVVIVRRDLVLGLCLLGLPAVTIYLHALVPFSGTRYVYPLMPIYALSIPLAIAMRRAVAPAPFVAGLAQLIRENVLRTSPS